MITHTMAMLINIHTLLGTIDLVTTIYPRTMR